MSWRKKKRRNLGFIGDDIEGFDVFGCHWEFLWVCDDFVFDVNRGEWIEEFDDDEDLSMFYWEIDGIL